MEYILDLTWEYYETLETCDICKGDIDHHVDEKTGKTYWTHGHNAEPVLNGRCCDTCNEHVLHCV